MLVAKKCRLCGRIVSITGYYEHKSYKDGLTGECKKCTIIKNYYWTREKRLDSQKKYYERNKEKSQQYQREYYKLNKDRYKKHKSDYIKKYPDKYYGKQRKNQIKRRSKTNGTVVSVTDVMALYGDICYLCGEKVLPQDRHLDHVEPLSRGGKHEIENIRITHRFCNLSKGNKLLEEIGVAI